MKVMRMGREKNWHWLLLCLSFKMLSVTKQTKQEKHVGPKSNWLKNKENSLLCESYVLWNRTESGIVWARGSWFNETPIFSLKFSWLWFPWWVDFFLTLGSLMEAKMAKAVAGFLYAVYIKSNFIPACKRKIWGFTLIDQLRSPPQPWTDLCSPQSRKHGLFPLD